MNANSKHSGNSMRNPARRSSLKLTRSIQHYTLDTLELRRLLSGTAAALPQYNAAALTLSYTNPGAYLTGPSAANPVTIAKNYLTSQSKAANLPASVFTDAQITDNYSDDLTGNSYVYLREIYNGLPVLNAVANAGIDRNGRILTAAQNFVALPDPSAIAPAISAADALSSFAQYTNLSLAQGVTITQPATGLNQQTRFSAPDLQSYEISAELTYVVVDSANIELSWHVILDLPDQSHWYELGISASSGQINFVSDYTDNASYNVYALPTEAPNDGVRTVLTNPELTNASPFGWHDTNGVAGPEYTSTRGNNANAYLDRDNNNAADAKVTDGGASLNFNFALDPATAPTSTANTNQEAAVTNLFYLNNRVHDITYQYGFTEAAGNFQVNNYGKGGAGNDAVLAEAQDGGGTNNANFASPADGSSGRMQMYIFNTTSPNRDGDLDALVVVHEYTHGISNRLTGGPANASALDNTQSGGMGEGWSDFMALMLTQKPSDTAATPIGVGTYVEGQSLTGAGIRRYRYSTDMTVDPETLGLYNSSSEVHDAGEIWTTVLWDLNWAMINKYGPTPDISAGFVSPAASGGSATTLRLVLDAMKLQPANPTFLQARDAIFAADLALTGGANNGLLWQTFARRGYGYNASTANSNSSTVTESFTVPNFNPNIAVLSQNLIAPTKSIDITFSEAINPASFSIAADIQSFTGPAGVNLLGKISGFSFTNSNTTLHLTLSSSIATNGVYSLVVGPNINAADNGNAMDQNFNSVTGEASDAATISITYNSYAGPDAFGYVAYATPYEAIDLVAGQSGVVTTSLNADDSSVSISLGTNTFSFYGTTYTSLYASTNGHLTFSSGSSAYLNSDLTSSPTQATISPLWDDLLTNFDANDQVLYRLQDTTGDSVPDRLIVEWSQVRDYDANTDPETFQAILELNTAGRAGTITFNYVDLNVGNASYNNGASATVGIKAAGTQGGNRLLLSNNNASSPYLGSGKAIKIAIKTPAPAVTTSTFTGGVTPSVNFTFAAPAAPIADLSALTLTDLSTGAPVSIDPGDILKSFNPTTRTLSFTAATSLPAGLYSATLSNPFAPDSTLTFLYVPAATTLNLAPGLGTVRTQQISITPTGTLNLNNNSLVLDYAGPSPLASLLPLFQSGFALNTWLGTGITSSAAASTPFHAVAYAEASDLLALSGVQTDTWQGQPVDSTSLLIKYTSTGDTDLDGSLTGADLSHAITGLSTGGTGYTHGDFNFDGVATPADYALLDAAFNAPPTPRGTGNNTGTGSNTGTATDSTDTSVAPAFITLPPATLPAGQRFPKLTITAAPNSNLTLSILSGPTDAKLLGTTHLSTRTGNAAFSNLSLKTAGTYTLALSDGLHTTTTSLTILPAAPAKLVFNSSTSLALQDKFGNLIPDSTSIAKLTITSKSALPFATSTPLRNGSALFSDLLLSPPANALLTATVGKLKASTKILLAD